MSITLRSSSSMRDEILATMQARRSNVDIQANQINYDMVTGIVEGGQYPIHFEVYRTYLNFVLRDPVQMSLDGLLDSRQLDDMAAFFGTARKGPVKARGEVVFLVGGTPSVSRTVPGGTVVSAQSSSGELLRYLTTEPVTLDANSPGLFFIPDLNAYGVEAPVEAEEPGTGSNLNPRAINTLITPVTGISSVTNLRPIDQGREAETDLELAQRILATRFRPDGISQRGGITAFLLDQDGVTDIGILSAGDPAVRRTIGRGTVDVYVRDVRSRTNIDEFVYAGLDTYQLFRQPVVSINYVRTPTVSLIETVDFVFEKDTSSLYPYSSQAQDRIRFLNPLTLGETVRISYLYNDNPSRLTSTLNTEEFQTPGRDIRVFEGIRRSIFVQVSVERNDTPASNVQQNVETAITNYVTQQARLGVGLTQSQILSVISGALGVTNVLLSTFQLRFVEELAGTTHDLVVSSREYLISLLSNILVTVAN